MSYVILHNENDAGSRDFVAAHGQGNEVLDWYNDAAARAAFEAAHPGVTPRAFPAVLVEAPAYRLVRADADCKVHEEGVDAVEVLVTVPGSWDDVTAFEAFAAKRAADNPA
ncbi:MAG: hypothetical protein JW718_07590 [Desulfovibrionaceae bacterium]|nr:hypothetical protein [Desulfovibrionaceae bacterium]